jgi:DNA ligase D-like protein (predicted ligase)
MISVMLAKQGNKSYLKSKDFIYEPKFDGTRVLVYKKGKKIEIVNRRKRDITYRYPELKDIWKNIKEDCILDGELVILGEKNFPDFNLLQKREQLENKLMIEILAKNHPATLFIFDILKLKNKNLMNFPLIERKKFLKNIKNSSKIVVCPYTRDGEKLWKKIKKIKLEGIIAKKINSKYEEGKRSSSWLKIKNLNTIDAIVIGFTKEKREISALVLAAYHKGKLIYIGRVAAGINDEIIRELSKKLKKIKKAPTQIKTRKKIYYVKPQIIVEVKYLQMTKNFQLRAPVFLRIRNDKLAKECILE